MLALEADSDNVVMAGDRDDGIIIVVVVVVVVVECQPASLSVCLSVCL